MSFAFQDRALDVANSTEVAKKIKQEHDDFEEFREILTLKFVTSFLPYL